MDYYFNQLMEIQNSTDHSFFLLDQDSEPRFVIEADKRTIIIPAEFQFLGVKTDQRSEKIYFEVDRIFDDVDLSTKTCVIQYINAGTDDVDEGIYPVTELDTTTVPGKIVFKWEVDNIVCKYAGVVAFSVRFYEIDPETKLYTYCWNTIPESLPVLDGLNVSGSVTEDFPTELLEWNARMAALNTEITNKISAADATMKADLKTAKGYMDGAQAARGGAEEAESRVKKIVAGNEAYTKTESDNVYAKSQVKESERGTSVEVYPEDGSNLAVTAYGFTEQAGTGDPSPTNVRQLTNGGIRLTKFVLDGNAVYSNVTVNANTVQFNTQPGGVNPVIEVGYCEVLELKSGNTSDSPHWFPSPANKYLTFYFPLSYFGGKTDKPSIVAALNANPVKVWYQDAGGTGSLYAPIIMTGSEYRATCLPLTAPLCDGDSVVSRAKSGCDKVVTFDGSEDENWVLAFQNNGFYIKVDDVTVLPGSTTLSGFVKSTYLTEITSTAIYNGTAYGISLYNANSYICVRIQGVSTVSALKEYLAAHPLTVWYRSTNYTPAADIPVSLETHVQAYKEYAVAAMNNAETYPGWKDSTLPSILGSGVNGAVYGAKSSVTKNIAVNTSQNAIWLPNSEVTLTQSEFKAQYPDMIVQVTLPYKTPITYAHQAVDIISNIADNGSILISGQKEISASYHKSLDKIIIELDNKSYSKKESHNIFARALRGTADAAQSITIYPDEGSNVVATIHGFTKQEGSGDASPANVRKILVGGRKLLEVTLTGSEPNVYRVEGNKTERDYFYQIRLNNNSEVGNFIPMSGNWGTKSVSNKFGSGNPYSTAGRVASAGKQDINPYNEIRLGFENDPGSIDRVKAILKKYYDDGDPIKIWCPLEDETKVTALFAAVTTANVGACSKLTAPLCKDDMFITQIDSGCDKTLLIDGTQTCEVFSKLTTVVRFNIRAGLSSFHEVPVAYSNYLTNLNDYTADFPHFYIRSSDGFVQCFLPKAWLDSYDNAGVQKYFSAHPLMIRYKSTNYVKESDKKVSLERHKKAVLVLDGTEGITLYWNGHKDEQLANGRVTFSWPMPYPYKAASEYASMVSHFKFFADVVSGLATGVGYQFAATRNIYVCLDLSTIDAVGETDDTTLRNKILRYLATQYSSGTPVTIEYQVMSELVYAHDPVDFIASPGKDGSWVITGEADGTVSAEYNKDITYAFNELQSAVLAAIANLSL